VRALPAVATVRISDVHVPGRKETLDVHNLAGGRPVAERFALVRLEGAWRIDGARRL
jgi:hypothetical protein